VVKGSAVYNTSTYQEPTAPLTAIDGTSLLLNFTNASIFDETGKIVVETVGDASVSTSVVKYGDSSMAFDGNQDHLRSPFSELYEFGSGNLTWEMWINTTNSTQYSTLFSKSPVSFATGNWTILMNNASATAGDIAVYVADFSTSAPLLSSTAVNVRDGNWHHIAVVRNNSSWVLYVNGVSRSTQTWSGTIANRVALITIGSDEFYGRHYLGYISDLRITKGVARYTANFTPPTAKLGYNNAE